jgi:hypothetical protein
MKTILALFAPLQACSEQKKPSVPGVHTDEDDVLMHRFRGIRGGELFVDASFETKGMSFILRMSGVKFPGGAGQYGPGAGLAASFLAMKKVVNDFLYLKRFVCCVIRQMQPLTSDGTIIVKTKDHFLTLASR